MTKLICGWCKKEFEVTISKDKWDERNIVCHCGRILPSSKKESTGNLVGRQHIHVEFKEGDVV